MFKHQSVTNRIGDYVRKTITLEKRRTLESSFIGKYLPYKELVA